MEQFLLHLGSYQNSLTCVFNGLSHVTCHRAMNTNKVNGTIPSELGQLWSVNIMCASLIHHIVTTHSYLQENLLTGTIPTELGQLWTVNNLCATMFITVLPLLITGFCITIY